MKRRIPVENTFRVFGVTIGLWAGGVALAGFEGVFAKLSAVTFALLVLFAAAYAAASYGLDRGLRTLAIAAGLRTLLAAAVASDALLAATAAAVARIDAPWIETAARFPVVMSALFVAPLAVALHIAAFGRVAEARRLKSIAAAPRLNSIAAAPRLSSAASARSPGANPAAT
jgi:hypothetical protein